MRRDQREAGISHIEMTVAMVIVGALSAIVIPTTMHLTSPSSGASTDANLTTAATMLMADYSGSTRFITTSAELSASLRKTLDSIAFVSGQAVATPTSRSMSVAAVPGSDGTMAVISALSGRTCDSVGVNVGSQSTPFATGIWYSAVAASTLPGGCSSTAVAASQAVWRRSFETAPKR